MWQKQLTSDNLLCVNTSQPSLCTLITLNAELEEEPLKGPSSSSAFILKIVFGISCFEEMLQFLPVPFPHHKRRND